MTQAVDSPQQYSPQPESAQQTLGTSGGSRAEDPLEKPNIKTRVVARKRKHVDLGHGATGEQWPTVKSPNVGDAAQQYTALMELDQSVHHCESRGWRNKPDGTRRLLIKVRPLSEVQPDERPTNQEKRQKDAQGTKDVSPSQEKSARGEPAAIKRDSVTNNKDQLTTSDEPTREKEASDERPVQQSETELEKPKHRLESSDEENGARKNEVGHTLAASMTDGSINMHGATDDVKNADGEQFKATKQLRIKEVKEQLRALHVDGKKLKDKAQKMRDGDPDLAASMYLSSGLKYLEQFDIVQQLILDQFDHEGKLDSYVAKEHVVSTSKLIKYAGKLWRDNQNPAMAAIAHTCAAAVMVKSAAMRRDLIVTLSDTTPLTKAALAAKVLLSVLPVVKPW